MARTVQSLKIGSHTLQISNVDKALWPRDGYTKGDLIAYYRNVARWLLPYLKDRPLTLQRWPDGIEHQSFFEKDAPRGTPEWVKTVSLPSGGKRTTVRYVVCNDEATLVFVANLAAITLHVWTSRLGSLDYPDFVLFDLDPWEGCTLKTLAAVALHVRKALEDLELAPLVKTSGGTGLHVILQLAPKYDYDSVKAFAEMVARRVADTNQDKVTLERMTRKRPRGTVYIDWVQVGKGKTIVPPFVVRARPGAPVSMPLGWSAVESMARKSVRDPLREFANWTMRNVPSLLQKHGDPWHAAGRKKHNLEAALRKARKAWREP
ncbi:MAG TPA: non-homologous end-joining DNA ligase [Candidatus Eremiobacteraceae bacterium]|nr:non-homologous end-joining DNA ligase [Candidatus Eremiobacteraceae bacterium]